MSPLLFLILTSDLPDSVVKGVNSARGVAQYADDSTGYTASKSWDRTEEDIAKMATNLEQYSFENGLHQNSKAKTGACSDPNIRHLECTRSYN